MARQEHRMAEVPRNLTPWEPNFSSPVALKAFSPLTSPLPHPRLFLSAFPASSSCCFLPLLFLVHTKPIRLLESREGGLPSVASCKACSHHCQSHSCRSKRCQPKPIIATVSTLDDQPRILLTHITSTRGRSNGASRRLWPF